MFGVRENPKIRPQIRTFGQGLPRNFQKKKKVNLNYPNFYFRRATSRNF